MISVRVCQYAPSFTFFSFILTLHCATCLNELLSLIQWNKFANEATITNMSLQVQCIQLRYCQCFYPISLCLSFSFYHIFFLFLLLFSVCILLNESKLLLQAVIRNHLIRINFAKYQIKHKINGKALNAFD